MFCPKCGAQTTGNERFCAKCGAPLEQAAAPAAPTVPGSSFDGQAFVNKVLGKNGDYRPMVTAVLALFGLLQAILWFLPCYQPKGASQYAQYGMSVPTFSMADFRSDFGSIVLFIGLLAVLAFSVLRLFDVKVGKLPVAACQKVGALEFGFMTFVMCVSPEGTEFTFGGVLFLISSIVVVLAAAVLAYLDSKNA